MNESQGIDGLRRGGPSRIDEWKKRKKRLVLASKTDKMRGIIPTNEEEEKGTGEATRRGPDR